MKKPTISLFMQLSKIVTLTVISFISIESQAMIIGGSCLKRNKTNKLVILYDKHAFDHSDTIKKGHVNDIQKIINITSKNPQPVPFLLEISEAHKNPDRLKNMIDSPGNIPVKIALNNNMKYGNINFIAFDNRAETDFWVRDMLLQENEFSHAIEEGFKFPSSFYNITAATVLNHLDSRQYYNINTIDNLPTNQNIKDQYKTSNHQKNRNCHQIISTLLKKYNVDQDRHHFFNLITQLNNTEKKQLFKILTEEHSFTVDMNLLHKTIDVSDKHSLSIIHAGSFHSHSTEQKILNHFPGFEKDTSSSLSLPDLQINNDDLYIQYPSYVPDNFMHQNMKSFISNTHE